MGRTRRKFGAEEKSRIVLEALQERQSISELAQKHQVHPSQIGLWKKQAIAGLKEVFSDGRAKSKEEDTVEKDLLYQQIGKLQFELEWVKKKGGYS